MIATTIKRLLAVFWLAACGLTAAHAQITQGTASGSSALFADLLAKPSAAGTMGITEGIIASNAGSVGVTTGAGRLNVPTTANATISKAAVGAAAVKLVRAASVIGAAYSTYEVYNWIKDSGITTCAPPDFFCKPATAGSYPFTTYPTCMDAVNNVSSINGCSTAVRAMTGLVWLRGTTNHSAMTTTYKCAQVATGSWDYPGYGFDCSSAAAVAAKPVGSPGGPYTDLELQSGLIGTGGNWDPARGKALYDAVRNDSARQPGVLASADLLPTNSPATVTAPPLVGPQTVKSTETITNADGTTSTRTTREQQTVTPTTTAPANGQPATASNPPKVSYPVTTVTTVTTVNNTTNVSNTTTTTAQTNGEADEDKSTLCKLFPDIVACAKLGTVPDAEKLVPVDVTPTITNTVFASSASCPAPISYNMGRLGGARAIEFSPVCDWMAGIRPLFLAIGAVATAFVFMRGVQKV